VSEATATSGPDSAQRTAFAVLATISVCHLLNDMMQSLLPALYPMLKGSLDLSFGQIGLVTLAFQLTASLLQPLVGSFTDRRPLPYSLAVGMGFTLVGLLLLSVAGTFPVLLLAAALVGMGSSVFHPESSRVARLASGGRHGLAQSLFQVGGNVGSAVGPLLAAFIVLPLGQLAMVLLFNVGTWYRRNRVARRPRGHAAGGTGLTRRQVGIALAVLLVLMFSKFIYLASLTSYFTFYLIERFGLSVQSAQLHLFLFLGAAAAGTFLGGPLGDRFGRKWVIWVSILGVLPFTLMLPYANLFWTGVLTVVIGLILSSAFSAIVVYGQELMPGRVGMTAGLFFGLAFGLGGVGAAVLGEVADVAGITLVYKLCAFLPALGILTILLPDLEARRRRRT